MSTRSTAVNQMLMSNGLGKLTDPGLIPQLGFLMGVVVRSHEQFRELLNKCEPAERRNMYEAMKPHLRFEAKPLDVYVAELAMIAEAKQLPVVAADGSLAPFQIAEIKTGELAVAQNAIAEAVANVRLHVVCKQCTREATFPGVTKPEALESLRAAGWRYDAQNDKEICPDCAK